MIHDSPSAQAVHITLQPGEALKRHATPVDVFFYILEGCGIVEIGDEQQGVVIGIADNIDLRKNAETLKLMDLIRRENRVFRSPRRRQIHRVDRLISRRYQRGGS